MKILISGGCKNGKSTYGESLAAKAGRPLYYIATMRPVDTEDTARIQAHQQARANMGFITIEQHTHIQDILKPEILKSVKPSASHFLDSVTALLANEMFDQNYQPDPTAVARICHGFGQILAAVENIVIISDYIYSDAIRYDPITEAYRKNLATIDRYLAQRCDQVIEVVGSQIIYHKGVPQ